MPENLFNLQTPFHAKKTNYFAEGTIVTLAPGTDLNAYLFAAAPVFHAAIDAKRAALIAAGVPVGSFKIDFLDAIKDSMSSPSLFGDHTC